SIEIARSHKGIFLSQRKYALDLLRDTGMLDVKPGDTPMSSGLKLVADEGEFYSNPEQYRRLVGKLNCLAVTRPDIAFSVSVVSQFLSSPHVPHWKAVKQILRYIKGTPSHSILYGDHGHLHVEGYFDADWAGSPGDRKSTTGYCIFVGGNL